MSMSDKIVVIIGAGFFGISTANRLAKSTNLKVILITISQNAYFLISSIRVPVQNKTEGTFIPLKEVVNSKVEVLRDEVINFTDNEIRLQQNGTVAFDSLVIATGSKWPDPIGSNLLFRDNYKEYFQEKHNEIEGAKHIILVGGGFNNCELLGELLFKYKDDLASGAKKVTVIHSNSLLLPGHSFYSETLRESVTDFVKTRDVDLRLNSRGNSLENDEKTLVINGNVNDTIKGDLIIYGTGTIPAVPNNSITHLSDSKGFIRINESFQAKEVLNGKVFAIGDVTDFEYRGLMIRRSWLNTIVNNVKLITQDPHVSASRLSRVERPKGHITSFVSIGPEHGFGQFCIPWIGTIRAPQWYIIKFKSRNLATPYAKRLFDS